jgi:hypothetical protein
MRHLLKHSFLFIIKDEHSPMKIADFGMSGISSLQGLLLDFCFEKC